MGINLLKKLSLTLCVILLSLCLIIPSATAYSAPDEPASSINSYLLGDLDTGEIIFANKPDERIYPASVTKMMTALVLLEKVPDLSVKVTVGSEINAFGPEASMMDLIEYEQISYLDLLYGMMLVSGNDAAATVAVNVGGSISGFADLMNAKAEELGMTNSHFVNPHGMNNEDHYTTAADLFKLACVCMKNETFAKVVRTSSYTTAPTNKAKNGHPLETTNRLISDKEKYASYTYDAAIGIKTGSTSAAKGCLVAAAQKNGRTLIAVLMGDDSHVNGQAYIKRWTDAVTFFDFGFSLTRVDLVPYMRQITLPAAVPGAQGTPNLEAGLPETLGYWTDVDTAACIAQNGAITVRIEYNEAYTVFAPLQKPLGTAVYAFNGEELCRAPVLVKYSASAETGNESAYKSPALSIALWALAFLICLSLLFLVLIAPRVIRKRRTLGMQGRPLRSVGNTPLQRNFKAEQHPEAHAAGDQPRQGDLTGKQNGSAEARNAENVRVLRSNRRTDRIEYRPQHDNNNPDNKRR